MKNLFNFRNFLFIFLALFLFGCPAPKDISPANIADKISGSYTMSLISANGQSINLPYNQGGEQLNGTISISKISTSTIALTYTLNTVISGVKNQKSDTGNFDIKANGNSIDLFDLGSTVKDGNSIDLFDLGSTVKVGTFSGTVLTIDSDGTKIVANKN
jgi:hypothetical protein